MKESNCWIEIGSSSNKWFRSNCDWKCISQLKHNERLGGDLINTILGAVNSLRSVHHLGTEIYPEVKKKGFGKSKTWLKDVPRAGQWLLAICDRNHWVAVCIDWIQGTIGYYDPAPVGTGAAGYRYKTITEVSEPTSAAPPELTSSQRGLEIGSGPPTMRQNTELGFPCEKGAHSKTRLTATIAVSTL